MKKLKISPYIIGVIVALLFLAVAFYIFCPAINVQNIGLWILIDIAVLVFVIATGIAKMISKDGLMNVVQNVSRSARGRRTMRNSFSVKGIFLPIIMTVVIILLAVIGSTVFNAESYSKILPVADADFSKDLSESVGTDSIALMDTASAQMLGDREIGALSDVVSQFNVSYDYTQIDYNGKPIKVSALEYAGFFKWINNKSNGVKGYVTVDPVSMSASFEKSEGMKYVPSAFFSEDAYRYIWSKYPTLILENLHFEIDEEGKPYYVVSVIDKKIGLFGGRTVSGCIVLDPVSGETVKYNVSDIPKWVDVVFSGDLICEQYNWHGMFQNGYINSMFAKKGCKQVTTYYSSDEEETDESPVSDYGYVAKDGDIWIYTGVTSVNGDSSNIGFLLANESRC